jgi:hypothetical protein
MCIRDSSVEASSDDVALVEQLLAEDPSDEDNV